MVQLQSDVSLSCTKASIPLLVVDLINLSFSCPGTTEDEQVDTVHILSAFFKVHRCAARQLNVSAYRLGGTYLAIHQSRWIHHCFIGDGIQVEKR